MNKKTCAVSKLGLQKVITSHLLLATLSFCCLSFSGADDEREKIQEREKESVERTKEKIIS